MFQKKVDSVCEIRVLGLSWAFNNQSFSCENVGDEGNHLYVLAEGEAEAIRDDKLLGKITPGKAFGELAILYNCTRTASVKGSV